MEYSNKERSDHDQQINTEKFKVFATTGLRVLVVDDDRACLRIAGKMLDTCKYEVTACKTAREALSILHEDKNRFDIVLTDMHMTDMNGVSLLESIGILEMDLPVVKKTSMKRKIGDENLDAGGKKKRFVWSQELHQKFVEAVEELGSYSTAVPKNILVVMKRMEVPNITRENIASHLQKYRSSIQKKQKEKSVMETPLQSIRSMDMLNIRSLRHSNSNPLINLQNNNYHPGSTSSQPAPMQHRLSNLSLANNRFGYGPTTIPVSGTGTGMSSVDLTTSNYSLNRNIGFSNEPIIQKSASIEGIFRRIGNPTPLSVDYSGLQSFDQVDKLLEKNYMAESSFLFPVIENMPGIKRTSSSEDFYNMLRWIQHEKDAGLSFDTLLLPNNPEQRDANP